MSRYVPLGITIALAVAFGVALAPHLGPILRFAGWLLLALLAIVVFLYLFGQAANAGDRAREEDRARRR